MKQEGERRNEALEKGRMQEDEEGRVQVEKVEYGRRDTNEGRKERKKESRKEEGGMRNVEEGEEKGRKKQDGRK